MAFCGTLQLQRQVHSLLNAFFFLFLLFFFFFFLRRKEEWVGVGGREQHD
jgi:hypothetical protein